MDPNEMLATIRMWCGKDNTESLDPHEVEQLTYAFQNLDAWICNGGFLPRDWDPTGPGLRDAVQVWVSLRDERTRVAEAEGGELDYDTLRQFEQEQADAATNIADTCADWFNRIGQLQ